eukprot:CAMPEP_0168557590 /NCGR_PEP_ID=MMETSP0413-20121227/9507_1 /TAXON_ID=136452 /ORGANISM="Filamoeba nolandi, Strain NC-AS-23-1" /LENGTH=125 /DNA_ID=CAMNT_0008588633 /DNA_START=14 /DNA_END=388 /DNA_ORIENTATION=-
MPPVREAIKQRYILILETYLDKCQKLARDNTNLRRKMFVTVSFLEFEEMRELTACNGPFQSWSEAKDHLEKEHVAEDIIEDLHRTWTGLKEEEFFFVVYIYDNRDKNYSIYLPVFNYETWGLRLR